MGIIDTWLLADSILINSLSFRLMRIIASLKELVIGLSLNMEFIQYIIRLNVILIRRRGIFKKGKKLFKILELKYNRIQ